MSDFKKVYCPLCKTIASSTVETVAGTADLIEVKDGLQYGGETTIEWDSQKTDRDDRGLTIFWCRSCSKEFGADMAEKT